MKDQVAWMITWISNLVCCESCVLRLHGLTKLLHNKLRKSLPLTSLEVNQLHLQPSSCKRGLVLFCKDNKYKPRLICLFWCTAPASAQGNGAAYCARIAYRDKHDSQHSSKIKKVLSM